MGQTHDKTFKQEAVRLVQTSGKSQRQIADDLGIGLSTPSRRCTEMAQSGEEAFVGSGNLRPEAIEKGPAQWSLDALTEAAHAAGIQVERSQIRRIYIREGVRWRRHRSTQSSSQALGLGTASKDPTASPSSLLLSPLRNGALPVVCWLGKSLLISSVYSEQSELR